MTQKKLAEEYALKEYARVNGSNDPIFEDNRCFTFDDIRAAFNAGRESVVGNMPELKWQEVCYLGREFIAAYPYGCRYEIEFVGMEFDLFRNRQFVTRSTSLSHVKQAANDDYKKRIKQALEL